MARDIVAEAAAEEKIERFLREINWLVDAGFPDGNPFFVLPGWHKQPREMGVADILEYVQHHFGEPYVGFCRGFEQLKVH
jgi:hypothetical protein